jgi:hypothetical protein
LNEKNKNIRVHVETRITMVLPRLGSENSLQMCGEVYDIVKSMKSIIRNFFFAMKTFEIIGDT